MAVLDLGIRVTNLGIRVTNLGKRLTRLRVSLTHLGVQLGCLVVSLDRHCQGKGLRSHVASHVSGEPYVREEHEHP
jgi:hypothetical protein